MCKLLELPDSFADEESSHSVEKNEEAKGGLVSTCGQCKNDAKSIVPNEFKTKFGELYQSDDSFKELCEVLGFNKFCKEH